VTWGDVVVAPQSPIVEVRPVMPFADAVWLVGIIAQTADGYSSPGTGTRSSVIQKVHGGADIRGPSGRFRLGPRWKTGGPVLHASLPAQGLQRRELLSRISLIPASTAAGRDLGQRPCSGGILGQLGESLRPASVGSTRASG
jgi:hypothetical protein